MAWVASALAGAAPAAVWTEAVGSGFTVRAIVEGGCPDLIADGVHLPMATRAPADQPFPVTACQALLPGSAAQLSIDGVAAPLFRSDVKRIVVIGDTGCRIKKSIVQDCNDPVRWPFAQVASNAALEKPDLVIHVGDYYYRETPCPADRAGCANSAHGDAWPAWSADFFTPAAPLLAAAPWIVVRGNHEQCGRGANGWFRFLDASAAPLACPTASAPFAVSLGALHLMVVDSADTVDDAAPADRVALFRGELDHFGPDLAAGTGWILTHRPIWGFAPPATGEEAGEIEEGIELPVNLTEQKAVADEKLDGIQLVLSGHVHLFAAADAGPKRPAQLIVGNGGDLRDGERPEIQARNVTIAGMPAQVFVVEQFGYFVLDRTPDGWQGTLKRADGSLLAHCTLMRRALACTAS